MKLEEEKEKKERGEDRKRGNAGSSVFSFWGRRRLKRKGGTERDGDLGERRLQRGKKK